MASAEARHRSSLRQYGKEYAADLYRLMTRKKGRELPTKWLVHSPDHFGLMAASEQDYYQRIERLRPLASMIIETEENGLRAAAAELEDPIVVDGIGRIGIVEIHEPSAPEQYARPNALHHVQFNPVNVRQIRSILNIHEVGYTYTQEADGELSWLDMPINGFQVARFSERPLAQVLRQKLNSGEARRI